MCSGLRTGKICAQARTQSSIAVTANDLDWVLFNASPDILQQIRSFPPLQPARALRDTAIVAIVLMDAQIDHTTGLYMLREHRRRWPIWCTELVKDDLTRGNPLFSLLEHYCGVDWHTVPAVAQMASQFAIDGAPGLSFDALPLTSNAPPYSPHRDQPQPGDNIGMTIRDSKTGKSVFYAPGLVAIEPHVWQAMCSADVVLVDGTLWSDDEMIKLGASKKTGAAMGHLAQSGPGGMIEWLDKLPKTTRKILIHINNTNPVLDEYGPQREELRRHGIEVAYDGMELSMAPQTDAPTRRLTEQRAQIRVAP